MLHWLQLTWNAARGPEPSVYDGRLSGLWWVLRVVIPVPLSVAVHELGHASAAWALGTSVAHA